VINSDRVVTKDDILEHIWSRVFVSEASISTAVKQVRRALGDDGDTQRYIKTVRGKGFRFVGTIEPSTIVAANKPDAGTGPVHGSGRPVLAVLRFLGGGNDPFENVLATAVPAEIVSAVSRTHWLQVIARGSSFRFDPIAFDPAVVAAQLGVSYIVTGSVEIGARTVAMAVELVSTVSGALVWSDRIGGPVSEVQLIRQKIVGELLTALETEIPRHEALHAQTLEGGELDAWSHFHIGLSHMLRFTPQDNLIAAQRFREAIGLNPDFARAHAGLSLTHWQNGFMGFQGGRSAHLESALSAAEQAVRLDPNDPFVAFNLGRAKWLEGDLDTAIHWLERGIEINPNHVHCHYSWAIIQALRNRPDASAKAIDTAVSLSPLDPLAYGFHGVNIANGLMLGDIDMAMASADRAVRLPGAHQHIYSTAAAAYEIAGDRAAALVQRDRTLNENPQYSLATYARTFPFQDTNYNAQVMAALKRLGLPD